jgi:CheY-like chemotaxis protein
VSLAGLRVLAVEDESLVAMMIEDFLEALGCAVAGTAARLEEALSMAAELDLDAAVLDVNLDGRPSYPVAETLRRRSVPFLFATGYGAAGVPEPLRDAPVLAKPFHKRQLAAALAGLAAAAGASDADTDDGEPSGGARPFD